MMRMRNVLLLFIIITVPKNITPLQYYLDHGVWSACANTFLIKTFMHHSQAYFLCEPTNEISNCLMYMCRS